MAANIAYAGEKPVPDADDDELALFERARKRALGEAFDLRRGKPPSPKRNGRRWCTC